jgi:UDP-2,3-diacylglucosamine pyrophosphatase LpxH
VFDSLNFHRLNKRHWKVLSLIRKLSDQIEIIWIIGNHDGAAQDLSHLLGVAVLDDHEFESGGRRILLQHGHQHDRFLDDHPLVTFLADCLYWFFQAIDPSHRIARFSKRSSKIFLRCAEKIEEGARHAARRRQCDVVCCGHTHLPLAVEAGDVHYFNSGSWCEKPCTYLVVSDGVVTLAEHDYVGKPAVGDDHSESVATTEHGAEPAHDEGASLLAEAAGGAETDGEVEREAVFPSEAETGEREPELVSR